MKLLVTLYAVALAAKKKATKLEKPEPEVFVDEVHYPRHILDELSAKTPFFIGQFCTTNFGI